MQNSAPSMTPLYKLLLETVIIHGSTEAPRDVKCLELLNFHYTLEDPTKSHIEYTLLPERQAVYEKYRDEELVWYLKGDLKASSAPSKFWLKLADDAGNINSNYGEMILHREEYPGETPLDHRNAMQSVLNTLHRDKSSRQAIAHYNLPRHYWEGNKDVPCTLTNQFLIRDDKLTLIANMRSQDLWKGTPYDIHWFSYLQMHIADTLGVGYGPLHMNIGSLHLYESDLENAKKLVNLTHFDHTKQSQEVKLFGHR